MNRRIKIIFYFFIISQISFGQDPHFSQFFVAPQFTNPAIIGTSSGNWRIISNWRQQWGNAGTPFNTQTFSGEYKILGKGEDGYVEDENMLNTLAVGSALMFDQTMNGAFRSTYAVGSFAYHARLNSLSRIGMGVNAIYGNRNIDYSGFLFGEQFTSGGFDATLPNGEVALLNTKPFFSLGAGIIYNYKTDYLNIDVGSSVFHLNKPKQTFVSDPNQSIPLRYAGHLNVEYSVNNFMLYSFNAIYQIQSSTNYFSIGGNLGFDMSDGQRKNILYAGAWFRERDSFYPYFGFLAGGIQMGFSYDITHSKQNQGPSKPRSHEISLIIKDRKQALDPTKCPHSPWK